MFEFITKNLNQILLLIRIQMVIIKIAKTLVLKFSKPLAKLCKTIKLGNKNLPINTKWVMRMDCDEYLTDELVDEINQT